MNENIYNNTNTCICCGEVIPEGRQVCKKCEYKYNRKSVFDDLTDDEKDNDWEDELYND